MDRTPGALFSTNEMVAGERFRYSPSVRRLMVCPGCGSAPGLARLGMHNCCNILRSLCTVISIVFAIPAAAFENCETNVLFDYVLFMRCTRAGVALVSRAAVVRDSRAALCLVRCATGIALARAAKRVT